MTSMGSHVQLNKTHPLPNFKDKRLSRQSRDEIIVGGSFPLQLRVHRYNFSCGVESCMLKSFEGGTGCFPAVMVRVGGE